MKLAYARAAVWEMKALREENPGLYREVRDMLLAVAESDVAMGPEVKPLNNRAGHLRLRCGTWRMVVAISQDRVVVLRVASRSEVYK